MIEEISLKPFFFAAPRSTEPGNSEGIPSSPHLDPDLLRSQLISLWSDNFLSIKVTSLTRQGPYTSLSLNKVWSWYNLHTLFALHPCQMSLPLLTQTHKDNQQSRPEMETNLVVLSTEELIKELGVCKLTRMAGGAGSRVGLQK